MHGLRWRGHPAPVVTPCVPAQDECHQPRAITATSSGARRVINPSLCKHEASGMPGVWDQAYLGPCPLPLAAQGG